MKQVLFAGKRKLLSIPILGILFLLFLPIAIGLGLGYLVYKKIGNSKLKYSLMVIILLFTFSMGSVWITAMVSPTKPIQTQEQTTQTQVTPTQQEQVSKTEMIKEVKEQTKTPTPTVENSPKKDKQEAKVVKVIDGDTLDASFNGKTERIRFIGVNTPETVDPRKPVECFGERASVVAKENLSGETIWLESDSSQSDRDKYNRLLRYVWTDDATVDFGKVMIATGFAYEYTYDTPYKYQKEYKQAQKEAEQSKKGLWADGACPIATAKPVATPTQTTNNPVTISSGSCKYSCTSPDRDCSDFSTHTEAQAFFNCCGFTTTYDPMRLDSVGVGDGVACESLP
jgi:micrococcal nuclease